MTGLNIPAIVERVVSGTVHDIGGDAIVTPSSHFGCDLGMDELDIDHVMIEVEEIVKVTLPHGEINEQSTVGDLVDLVRERIKENEESLARAPEVKKAWDGAP